MTGFDEEAANVTMFFNFARHQVLNLLYKIRKVLRTQMLLAGATICAETKKQQDAKNSAETVQTSTPISPNSHIARLLAASGRVGTGDDELAEVALDGLGCGEVRRRKNLALDEEAPDSLYLVTLSCEASSRRRRMS